MVAAYRTAAVFADPETTDLAELECWLRAVVPIETPAMTGRRFVMPVLYDGADLPLVASRMRIDHGRGDRPPLRSRIRRIRDRLSGGISLCGLPAALAFGPGPP